MSYSEGKISAPIAASDPYYVMGVGTYNGGYDVGYICSNQHGKINKWSKYKPIKYPNLGIIDELSFATKNYGIMANNSLNFQTAAAYRFYYEPPTGGDNEPFRLTDFEFYNQNAIAPFRPAPDQTIKYVQNGIFNAYIEYDSDETPYNIRPADLNIIKNYYPACAIIYGYRDEYNIWRTSNNTFAELKNNGAPISIEFPMSNPPFNSAQMYMGAKLVWFCSRYKNITGTPEGDTDFYPLMFEGDNDHTSRLTIQRGTDTSFEPVGIYKTPNPFYNNIADYIDTPFINDSSCGIFVVFKIDTHEDSFSFKPSDLKIESSENFTTMSNGSTGFLSVDNAYKIENNKTIALPLLETITIPPNTTYYYGVYRNELFRYFDSAYSGNIVTNETRQLRITLKDTSDGIPTFSTMDILMVIQ